MAGTRAAWEGIQRGIEAHVVIWVTNRTVNSPNPTASPNNIRVSKTLTSADQVSRVQRVPWRRCPDESFLNRLAE